MKYVINYEKVLDDVKKLQEKFPEGEEFSNIKKIMKEFLNIEIYNLGEGICDFNYGRISTSIINKRGVAVLNNKFDIYHENGILIEESLTLAEIKNNLIS